MDVVLEVDHRDLVAKLITQRFPFDRTVQAFELADTQPDQVCKIVIAVNGDT
jgi:threonine dehydrogenase-like Zn-dependent dehydrogenase